MSTLRIDNTEITFVVQGPVSASQERRQFDGITQRCLESIRVFFPGSKIILATWKGQPTDGLDYDVLLKLDDPGVNTIYTYGVPQLLNNNRQIVSTHQGLKMVDTQYAVKLRADNLICGRGFVDFFCKYYNNEKSATRYLSSRIVSSNVFFLRYRRGLPVFFHKSDFFDFGLTEDLLKVWPNKLIGEINFKPTQMFKTEPPSTEQFLCTNWLSGLLDESILIHDLYIDDAGLGKQFWDHFIKGNIIIASPEELGLDVTSRFYNRGRKYLEYDHKDWLELTGHTKPKVSWRKAYQKLDSVVYKIRRFLAGAK